MGRVPCKSIYIQYFGQFVDDVEKYDKVKYELVQDEVNALKKRT